MQPYFFPYLDYFRLPFVADVFVLLDDVQFPRRGFVHRNKFSKNDNNMDWLTLSLVKGGQRELKIQDLEFKSEASDILHSQSKKFEIINQNQETDLLKNFLFDLNLPVIDYLERGLKKIIDILKIESSYIRSSEISNKKQLRGSDRIIQIVRELEGVIYVNSPGGNGLYDANQFRESGISLKVLRETRNHRVSSLERVLKNSSTDLIREVIESATY